MHSFFFRLLLLFLPTQLGYHFWPEWAYVLGRRVDYLSPTIFLTDVLIGCLFVSWFFETQKKFSINNFQFLIKRRNFQFLIVELAPILFFIGLNIFFATSRSVAIYKWLKILEFVALGWYIIKTRPNVSRITYYLSLGVLYSSLLAIFQFLFQHSLGGPLWLLGERTFTVDTPGIARLSWCLIPGSWCRELLRPYATFPHPNVLGGYLATILPLVIIQLSNNQILKLSNKIFYPLTILFGSIALLLTFSRSAWIVGGVVIVLTIARIRKYELGIMKKSSYVIFLFLIILYSLFMIHNSTEESIVVRMALNESAITMWRQHPLFGVGLGNFLVRLPESIPTRQIYFLQPVHNIYLLVLAETGVVGFVLFFLLLWTSIKGLVVRIKERNEKKSLILNTQYLPLFVFLLLGLVDHYPITLQQGQLLLTILLVLQ